MTGPRWSNMNGYRGRTVELGGGRSTTVYEHREIMAGIVGRPLRRDEHVHHRDGNRSNNDPANLELLTAEEHARRHNPGTGEVATVELVCIRCRAAFSRVARYERGNRKAAKAGPFCGKRCAGSWSREQQIAAGQIDLGGGRPKKEHSARAAAFEEMGRC